MWQNVLIMSFPQLKTFHELQNKIFKSVPLYMGIALKYVKRKLSCILREYVSHFKCVFKELTLKYHDMSW